VEAALALYLISKKICGDPLRL